MHFFTVTGMVKTGNRESLSIGAGKNGSFDATKRNKLKPQYKISQLSVTFRFFDATPCLSIPL